MRKELYSRVSVLAGVAVLGLTAVQSNGQVNEPATKNRFRLSYRPGFNISASFKNLSEPGPALAGIDHFYDDGYNRVDNTGNRGNFTWYWGIQNASQAPGDGYLYMHSLYSSTVKDRSDDPQHGGQFSYSRYLGAIGRVLWGIEGAANYTAVDINDSWAGNVSLLTDRYLFPLTYPWLGTGGRVSPANIPYNGTYYPKYGSDTPLLSDVPERTLVQANATAHRKLSADLYGFKVGPYFELPLSDRWAVSLSGGFAWAYIDSEFKYYESVSSSSFFRQGSNSKDDVLLGGYVGANLSWMLTPTLSLFAGAEYQNLGTLSQTANTKESVLNLENSVFVNVGCGISF